MQPPRSGVLALATLVAGTMLPVTAAQADTAPAPLDGVLISEVVSGGPSGSSENFIELTNYGSTPADISGWLIYRCGQAGDAYGPQAVAPEGTVLQPGEQYTAVREGSPLASTELADITYETTLHSFGYGAYLQNADREIVDRVGFYHSSVDSECKNPVSLPNTASWLHDQSHQRAGLTGDVTRDWIVAERTPGAPNVTAPQDLTVPSKVRITEYAPGGPRGFSDDFIEFTNLGQEPVDVSGWKVYRCGDNSQTYVQHAGLPAGTVLAPGEVFTLVRAGDGSSVPADVVDATYPTSVHWINSGAMVTTADLQIVDRFSMYRDRMSPCTDGDAEPMAIDATAGESYQRISDTGNNDADFVAAYRTPGTVAAAADLVPVDRGVSPFAEVVEISEISAAGPGGSADEFFELVNRGDAPVSLQGWSVYRCEGTGRLAAEPQIADLAATLAPGGLYVGAQSTAPEALRALADGLYTTGLNQADGYGLLVLDDAGRRVDSISVYDTIGFSVCTEGYEVQNTTRNDLGESHQRARHTGAGGDDFMKAPRSPGVDTPPTWEDPTVPRDGQLDPVQVPTSVMPDTPRWVQDGTQDTDGAPTVTEIVVDSAADQDLTVTFRSAATVDATTVVHAGRTAELPTTREIPGEVAGSEIAAGPGFPFLRHTVAVDAVPADGLEFTWSGTTTDRNELQLYGWDPAAAGWTLLHAAAPSADGDLTLVGTLPAAWVVDGSVDVLVVDGPRTSGGLLDEIGVTDGDFADPAAYDFALNHMTDTQFLSEDFRRVFTDMAAWVVANADSRKIAYNSLTGDIIENWINGNSDQARARREFQAAHDIVSLINDANVANGVLPGNHDNLWGRNNDLYNEYFPVEMFSDKPWWGDSWAPGDNSAHYDLFSHEGVDFMVLNLPYRPTEEQMVWAAETAAAHPDTNVILATHSYLNTAGDRETRDSRYSARGLDIWEKVVAPSDNIFLVIGGHYHGVATQYADPVTGEQTDATEVAPGTVAVDNVGSTGRLVIEMLADYQGYRSTQPGTRADTLDRDTGFQRLLQFDLDAGLMAVNAYSPTLDSFEAWRYDEPGFRGDAARYDAGDDEFVVSLSLIRSTELAAGAVTVTAPSEVAATSQVAPGTAVSHTWSEQDAGRSWYAVVAPAADALARSVVTADRAVVTAPRTLAGAVDPGTTEPTTPAEPEPTDSQPVPTDSQPVPTDSQPVPTDSSVAPTSGGTTTGSDPAGSSDQGGAAHALPNTGTSPLLPTLVGLLLLALGAVGVLFGRRSAAQRH